MKIKNAWIVKVDFDGDIASKASGLHVFAGEDAYGEVREIVRIALIDLNNHTKDYTTNTVDVGEYDVPITEVIADNQILDEFIEYGGFMGGNWEIAIYNTETWS